MELETLNLLNQLIEQGTKLTNEIKFVPPRPNVTRFYSVYEVSTPSEYAEWRSTVERFVKTYYQEELNTLSGIADKITPENHQKRLGLLKAIKLLPKSRSISITPNITQPLININNTQNQTQSQTLILDIFVEAIKDEISGKEWKELKQLIEEYKNESEPENVKPKLLEKIKGFGENVLAGIVAGIVTNPNLLNQI